MRGFAIPLGPFSVLVRQRTLVFELSKRDVLGRYRGAAFGLLWSLISPFLMLLVYTLAFGHILKSRWPGSDGSTQDFVLILFVGLIVHGYFAECLVRAPHLVLGNPSYVKKVVFPLDALIWSMVFSAVFHLATNIAILVGMKLYLHGQVYWTTTLLPLVLLPLLMLSAGIGFLLSAIGVFVRDVGQFVGVLAAAMLFLSSAIVPVEALPAEYRWIFHLNPLTLMIDQAREVVVWGRLPDWRQLGVHMLLSTAFMLIAFSAFQKMRKGFADVL
jgi:lipopolysaccharide transport system permease protein